MFLWLASLSLQTKHVKVSLSLFVRSCCFRCFPNGFQRGGHRCANGPNFVRSGTNGSLTSRCTRHIRVGYTEAHPVHPTSRSSHTTRPSWSVSGVGRLIQDVVMWFESCHLLLYTTKIWEMVVDFRRTR